MLVQARIRCHMAKAMWVAVGVDVCGSSEIAWAGARYAGEKSSPESV